MGEKRFGEPLRSLAGFLVAIARQDGKRSALVLQPDVKKGIADHGAVKHLATLDGAEHHAATFSDGSAINV
ncbi:hypothetical protein [Stutzerimonas kunmingensis]|uniref:hypothetical protein n=1 Tax=Stutzerimonas kunmingensis TaxID=1211807 RepID=UPI0035D08221